MDHGRSGLICASPPGCRHIITRMVQTWTEYQPSYRQLPHTAPPAPTRTFLGKAHHTFRSTLQRTPQPREGNCLIKSASSLRGALASLVAGTLSPLLELVSCVDGLRPSTAIIAASATAAILTDPAFASTALSSTEVSTAKALPTTSAAHEVSSWVRTSNSSFN
jgi:hypothetical protein